MKTMAAVLHEHGKPLVVDEVEIPDPAPDQVLVKLIASGVCHSQLHQIHNPASPMPLMLGHEATGVVEKAGGQVTHVKEGDPVMLTWLPRQPGRRPSTPTIYKLRGQEIRASVATWTEHSLLPEQYVVKMPAGIAMDVTAVVGCAVMTGSGAVINTAKVQAGQSVAVFGCGGVGLCILQAAAIVGANPIIAVDLAKEKLEFASAFGATHLVNAAETDAVAEVIKISEGGVDYAYDAIGVPQTVVQILRAVKAGIPGLRYGGLAVLVGIVTQPTSIDAQLFRGERRYMMSLGGSPNPDKDFGLYLDWFREGKLKLDKLVTQRFKLSEINDAVTALEKGQISGRCIIEYA